MARCDKLLKKATTSATSLRFAELCAPAECWGYEAKGGRGSHRKFKHRTLQLPVRYAMMVFQDTKGEAKPYQVRQLLEAIAHIRERNLDV